MFEGWIGYSQWIKKQFSFYPTKDMLVELAKMDRGQRKAHTWFGLYVWEKGRGFMKGVNTR